MTPRCKRRELKNYCLLFEREAAPFLSKAVGFFIYMNFLEKDLEQIIYEANRHSLADRGLYDFGIFKRQLRIGNYGIADIVSIRRPYVDPTNKVPYKGLITIYELKKDVISGSTFFQALGYLKGIDRYLRKRNKEDFYDFSIRLIGSSVDTSNSFCYLSEFVNSTDDSCIGSYNSLNLEVYTYKYDFNGISFTEQSGFKMMNEGF